MCTKKNRRLVITEALILIFSAVLLSSGSCQNAEPKGSFRSSRTNHPDEAFNSALLDQRFEWDEPEGEVDKSFEADAKGANPSLTDPGKPNGRAPEAPAIRDARVDERSKESSEMENRDDEITKKIENFDALPNRCNSVRGSKRRLCNESRLKKRRRYSSVARGSDETDVPSSNRIRGSSARARKPQDKGQSRGKNRGRKRGGKRGRKQESKMRSRKNNSVRTSLEAPAALRQAGGESVRRNYEDDEDDEDVRTTKGFGTKDASSNETTNLPEKLVTSDSEITKASERDPRLMKYFDSENTAAPGVTTKPEVPGNIGPGTIGEAPKDRADDGRKRYEENVEHEFSRNLEKEILWSRTELPEILDESPLGKNDGKNFSSMEAKPGSGRLDFTDSRETIKSARFDAAKMLGYSRTAEDLPIMDLENEVLTRTIEDYNTYLKNVGRGSQIRDDEIDSSRDDENPIPIRRPVYDENDDRGKLKESEQDEPEAPLNAETGSNLRGDLTCINGTFIPAPLARHALIKYVKSAIPGHEYLEADYECMPGFYMASSSSRLLCKNRRWIGVLPSCKPRRGQSGACAESSCDQVCNEVDGQAKCSCYKGFRLDGHKCHDVNECDSENGGCEYKCVNTPGSYRCECPEGMKRGETKFTCVDVDECLLNNGHGPCQDTCRNRDRGYVCSCDGLPGTVLSSDNHTCQDSGPCALNNAGCSHTCLSTMGRVFCLCPDGFVLADDWKTCQDIDECYVTDLQTEVCRYGCINTPGSYRCVDPTELSDQPIKNSASVSACFPGYELTAGSACTDINECIVNNGGCSEVCENTEGSFFCACDGDEKALSADGKSCTDINNLACPSLDPARRGYLMCSRETTPRMWRDGSREANRPGTKCYLKCPVGYQLHGEYELTCQGDGTWDGPKHGECVKYSKPRLECPKEVVAEVPPDRDEAFVTFDQPSTDLDWFRYVRSKPSWGTRLEASLKPGLHLVTFFVRHPISKRQASCVLRIIVKEGEAPKVNNCPSDISGKNGTIFTWTEPTFTDNVGVTHTSNNENPGKTFGLGEWKVVYEASDEAGWTTRCVFSVVVHQD